MKKLTATVLALIAIAGIAAAEITYPVDVANSRWAILDTTTAEIIKRNSVWPVADGGEIPGLATNLVILRHINDAVPEYDHRVFILHSTETIDGPNNQIRKSHSAVRRDVDEIITAAENVEAEQLATIIQLQREMIQTRLVLGAVIKHALRNQTYPARVQTVVDRYELRAGRVWKNRDRLTALKLSIEAVEDFDLDAGWETNE